MPKPDPVKRHPTDALPTSKFNITTSDAQLNTFSGDPLMPFEKSGVASLRTLESPGCREPS